MKIVLHSIAFCFVFVLILFLATQPLSISSCDRLYIYTHENEFQDTLSIQCLSSDSLKGKGWFLFQSSPYIPPIPCSYFENETTLTTDISHFPVGEYQVQFMTSGTQKAMFSNWIPFYVSSEAPTLTLSEDPGRPLQVEGTHCSFTCTSSQPLIEAYLTLHNHTYPLQSVSSQEWSFQGDLPLRNGHNTILIHGKNYHHVSNHIPLQIMYTEPTFAKRVFVLGYHDIGGYHQKWVVSSDAFEKQLQYLFENGYYFCTPTEVLLFNQQKLSLPDKSILLTFDDGCKGVFTHALPLLKRYNAKATLFIINSTIGIPGYLTWEELDAIMESGLFTLGSHSYDLHGWVDYTMIPGGGHVPKITHLFEETWDEYLQRVRSDLKKSRNELYDRYKQPILFFAYPFGEYNSQSIKRLKECGFIGAFTFNQSEHFVTTASNSYALDRIPMLEDTKLQVLLEAE
ncbi:MAG: polysaccharide deacetylase family protein [Caldisericia bacterium]|nr:polysaccharide deacetylase family protein [Caldisericia bacterium]MDD4614201.1 polysaccharide deacetylase family protein [Caldisericia bacterium]